ncbi:PAS domain-containing sensor histidine kinase [Halogeometricum sp. S1BR25-6]|uniref:histidine kinase n=1 Tax=Halogeometricum salsisoli TaxID=2950536 RepID=A0ABU2GDT9_9EURY|nr:PAS domain-containing sensor histidine kinase [Halogeometricum sp. S1BR25-6]MDS0298980.1 PAS domain-containing sensor histidine kinase [Halogeometricum sp. S1BR25-6]
MEWSPDEDDVRLGGEVYRQAFRSTGAPALIADPNFVIRDVNDSGLEFLGYRPGELVGRSAAEISGEDDIYADIVDHLSRGETWSGRFVARTSDGDKVYGRGTAAPILVDDDVEGVVAIFVDTTKQQQYENASEVLNRLLRHDLRNELNVMYGHIQRAQSADSEEEATESLQKAQKLILEIVRKSERARDLRDLLERSYAATNRPVRLDIVLNNAMVEVMREFPGATFRFEVFPEVVVNADDLLSTAVEAVLENAVAHNDADDPVVTVDVEVNEDHVVLSVADNGPGVPESQRDLIFGREEYDQLHHGTGISLFFADSVFDSYGGDIWVESNDSNGATFKIRLARV